MKSYSDLHFEIRSRMREEARSSCGRFGVEVPQRTESAGQPGCGWTIGELPSKSTAPRPAVPFMFNSLCSAGQRRSASTSSTRASSWARTKARFAVNLLFPSLGTELVTNTTFGELSPCQESNEVRTERSASRNGE